MKLGPAPFITYPLGPAFSFSHKSGLGLHLCSFAVDASDLPIQEEEEKGGGKEGSVPDVFRCEPKDRNEPGLKGERE